MFRPVPEPTECWRWSSGAVLSQYHQRNGAGSPEPTSGRFWTRRLELTSTWKRVVIQRLFLPSPYGNNKLMNHTIKGIYSGNQERVQSWLLLSLLINRGWDGWMPSATRWAWVWVNSGSWWWTGRPGVLRFMGSHTVGHDWETGLNLNLNSLTRVRDLI